MALYTSKMSSNFSKNNVNSTSSRRLINNLCLLFFTGFANDQFNFHDPLLGNKILFKSDKHQVECHITPTDVSEKRIGCETE